MQHSPVVDVVKAYYWESFKFKEDLKMVISIARKLWLPNTDVKMVHDSIMEGRSPRKPYIKGTILLDGLPN